MNIAMWSGPRNLSTAMMYSFGARADCAIWDEPYYAAYLAATGIDHPMASEIIARYETDPARIAAACAQPAPGGEPHYYQKHMPHHMEPQFELPWLDTAVHVFLIRHPARVLASYHAKRQNPVLSDIGVAAQSLLFDRIAAETGRAPVVVDSGDVRADPQSVLSRLCARIGLPFDPAMLSWPAGGNAADGIWGRHWYGAIHRSTGFAGPEGALPKVPPALHHVLEAALPPYERLRALAI
ncbi:MAG: HAD family hydrolase [Pseudomonadota bacterium]